MKAFYKLFCLVVMTALVFSLTACAPIDSGSPSTGNYEVYTDGGLINGDDCLVMNDSALTYTLDCPITKPASTVITDTLNGKEYTLHYKQSSITYWNKELYYYESEDQTIFFRYLADNMQLFEIILNDQDMSVFENMTLAEYEAWITEFVSQYCTEDWDSYLKTYQTWYRGANGFTKVSDYVADIPEDAELNTRVFTYIKPYGELRTNDSIAVKLYFEDNKIIVSLNANKFAKYDVNLDTEKMHQAITDHVKIRLIENHTLQNITFEYGELTNQGGNILCRWKITVHVQDNDGEVLTGDYYVLVDVPDA